MSYILDALRRADSERERGRVPGIHAQPLPTTSADAARRAPPPWVWVAVGLSLGLLAALGWTMWGRDTPPPLPSEMTGLPPPPPPATQSGRMSTEPPPPLPDAARPAEPPPVAPIEQRPTSIEAARKPAPPARAASAAAAPGAAAPGAAPPAALPSAPVADTRIYARHELPDDIRRQLPALSIGGSIYSPTPANRFVVVNGVVVHEGGEVGPEHVLEQIKLKSAVLRFKGYRYEILF
jgi:general secretion pathway protein B